jgi:hypothetical protein
MPTINVADAFLQAARTRLLTAEGLPAFRAWSNQRAKPPVDASWVADEVVGWDTEPAECGPNPLQFASIDYAVTLYVPLGEDAQTATSTMYAIAATFRASPFTVLGRVCEFTAARNDPPQQSAPWQAFSLTLSFFHQHP